MSTLAAPASATELAEVVRSCPRCLARGAGTKPRLSALEVPRLSTLELRGIVEYEPSEFTFTAKAGTAVRELADTLATCGQYLPFDPMLMDSGATLGGTVAAGLSGPGRLRFGGLKDFILGVQFVDGLGRMLRVGGKVVKNAAGFDLPKFFVGSLGRFGVLTELTFKVFPSPAATLTLKLTATNIESATQMLVEISKGRWQAEALDILPGSCDVYLRLGGPAEALQALARDILGRWPGEMLPGPDAQRVWSDLREFKWAHPQGALMKIALTPSTLRSFYHGLHSLNDARLHVSAGGDMAFVSLGATEQIALINELLKRLGLSALTFRGAAPLWCGASQRLKIADAVKQALDPQGRFPGLEDT